MFEELTDQCGNKKWPRGGNNHSTAFRHHDATSDAFPVQSGGHSCSCRGNRNFADEYVWSPTASSQLQPGQQQGQQQQTTFDASHTCRLLGNRTVLFLGDSTSQQAAATLMNALQPANCAPQVHFAQSDTLVGYKKSKERGFHWFSEVLRVQPDICVWGLGPHIKNQSVYRPIFESVVTNMTRYQNEQRANGTRVTQFVYKTQQPGGCSSKDMLPIGADEAAALEMNRTAAYNYRFFYDRDLYALSYLANISMPVMDLRMLYARPDAHIDSQLTSGPQVDCLHICSPGPLDVVPDLFQILLETKAV